MPLRVVFHADGNDPDGPNSQLVYAWEFGDGGGAFGRNAPHTYRETGTVTATVTVTDPQEVLTLLGKAPQNTFEVQLRALRALIDWLTYGTALVQRDAALATVGVAGLVVPALLEGDRPPPLGAGGVIEGWEQGLVGVQEGGIRQIDIPADLAYGDHARGAIQPGDALSFVVEVVSITQGE